MLKIKFTDAVLTLPVKKLIEIGRVSISGKNSELLYDILDGEFGLRHLVNLSATSPEELIAAVKRSKLKYEIVEGADILKQDFPLKKGQIV